MKDEQATLFIPPVCASAHADTLVWCPQGCGLELKYKHLKPSKLGLTCPFCLYAIDGTKPGEGNPG